MCVCVGVWLGVWLGVCVFVWVAGCICVCIRAGSERENSLHVLLSSQKLGDETMWCMYQFHYNISITLSLVDAVISCCCFTFNVFRHLMWSCGTATGCCFTSATLIKTGQHIFDMMPFGPFKIEFTDFFESIINTFWIQYWHLITVYINIIICMELYGRKLTWPHLMNSGVFYFIKFYYVTFCSKLTWVERQYAQIPFSPSIMCFFFLCSQIAQYTEIIKNTVFVQLMWHNKAYVKSRGSLKHNTLIIYLNVYLN